MVSAKSSNQCWGPVLFTTVNDMGKGLLNLQMLPTPVRSDDTKKQNKIKRLRCHRTLAVKIKMHLMPGAK